MKHIKLKKNLLVGNRYHNAGSVVEVKDARAKVLVARGHAEYTDAPPPKTVQPQKETAKAENPKKETAKIDPPKEAKK